MAQNNFEGNLEDINERQLEFIYKVIQKQDLQVTKVVFSSVGQVGDNYGANVKRINIEGKNGCLKLIVKVASTNEMVRKITNTDALFNNEHIMYTAVLPKLVQLQKDAGVPEKEQLRYAKCYGTLPDAPNEIIILEDLNELDFVTLNKVESLTNECVESILKNFAILHSLSYALKKKEPETYDLFKSKLVDLSVLVDNDQEIMSHIQSFESDILSAFEDKAHKRILDNKISESIKLAVKFAKTGDNKYSIIQQGDAWTNNIMFKFVGSKLVQSIMIDYQAAKINSPAVDLLFMIFNCTDHESRCKNYYKWLDYYYKELDNSLSNFNLKANIVYPRYQMDADLKRYGKLQFGQSVLLSNILARNSAEASKYIEARKSSDIGDVVETMKTESMPHETMVRFRTRVVGLIDSFTEFGLL